MKFDLIHTACPSWFRATTSRASALAIVTFSVLFFACSTYGQSVPGFQSPDKPKVKDETPVAVKAARGEVPLSKMYGHLKVNAAKTKRLGQLSPSEQKSKKGNKFLRIGVVRPLATPLDPLSDSALYTVAEGDVRVAGVISEGAVAVRVQFKGMSLPAGARVFVYSMSNPDEYYGPYGGHGPSEDGTFWTPPMRGDTAIIEYFTPAGTTSNQTPFKIFSIAHIYKDMFTPDAAGACENEVTPDWLNVAKSVGRVDFVSGGSVGACTGALLNDQASDQKPYFLTANHCISTQSEAQSVTVYWNYNTGDTPPGGTPTTNGSNLLVTGTSSDFTLLFLTGTVPGGLFFSGWDSATFNGTAAGTGIHHPQASHKRISFGTARQPNAGDCNPGEQCLRVDWSSGVTEPGSSGSGIWIGNPTTGDARLIGNLTGGPSECGAPASSLWDTYGRFSVTYPSISSFLEGTNCVTSLSPTSQNFTATGGTGNINVTAPGGCNWTAVTTDNFVSITSGASGSGNGTVSFSVASNSGPQRFASIVVGGQVFNVFQIGGGACAPTPISIGQTVNGNLTTNACPLGDGTYYDVYSFSGTASQRISVLMTSTEFDTYLFLNNPDGSNLAQNDDGGGGTNSRIPPGSGGITLPTTGTYTIWANAFDPSDTTGAYSLTLSAVVTRTLTVASQNPAGVSIPANPTDNNGVPGGTTQYTLTYDDGRGVNLFAPGTAPNGNIFQKWLKDGVDTTQPQTALVIMDADHTMTAVYGPPILFPLTVASSNPDSGVSITVSPNDNDGLGSGTTQFTRNYRSYAIVNLTAPPTAPNGNIFQKWRRNGQDYHTSSDTSVIMEGPYTMTAVYVPPAPFTLTVASSNPNSGANITVAPNDNNGMGDGTTQFTRTYLQNTTVTLTAPESANGNKFDKWLLNGNGWSFTRTTSVTMANNVAVGGTINLTAVFVTTPNVFTEAGTNNVAAVNSVTFLRGPFQILDPHNFSMDGHTRIILFTSDLGITQSDPPPTVLVSGNISLPVEAAGPLTGVPGLTGTYIVVKLPDGLPTGALQLTVLFRGVTGDARTLNISQ